MLISMTVANYLQGYKKSVLGTDWWNIDISFYGKWLLSSDKD